MTNFNTVPSDKIAGKYRQIYDYLRPGPSKV